MSSSHLSKNFFLSPIGFSWTKMLGSTLLNTPWPSRDQLDLLWQSKKYFSVWLRHSQPTSIWQLLNTRILLKINAKSFLVVVVLAVCLPQHKIIFSAFNNASKKLKIRWINSVKGHLSIEIMSFQRLILGDKKKFFDTFWIEIMLSTFQQISSYINYFWIL